MSNSSNNDLMDNYELSKSEIKEGFFFKLYKSDKIIDSESWLLPSISSSESSLRSIVLIEETEMMVMEVHVFLSYRTSIPSYQVVVDTESEVVICCLEINDQ